MFGKKKKKEEIRFFNVVPGVSTLYPITRSYELDREWVSAEKKEYQERVGQCPLKRFGDILPFKNNGEGIPPQLQSFLSNTADMMRNSPDFNRQVISPTSIGKCPAINSIMHSGFVVHAPADFTVYTNGDGKTIQHHHDGFFPSDKRGSKYIETHGPEHSEWLKDSTKDSTISTILKIHTMWRVIANPDIVFLVLKVPYTKESRFSAVTGILDPRFSPECNVQLWWHVKSDEVVVKAGTPLAMYLPISRKLLEYNASIGSATDDELRLEDEMTYMLQSQYSENRNPRIKTNKIVENFWKKWKS